MKIMPGSDRIVSGTSGLPRRLLVGAALAMLASAGSGAAVITFDQVWPWDTILNESGGYVAEGFEFTPHMGNANGYIIVGCYQPENNPQGNQEMVNNGTPNLVCANWVNLRLAGVGGQTFNLAGFEIGGTFNQEMVHHWSWASAVNIVGHRADGGPDYTLWYEINDDGHIDHAMQSVVLNWGGLTSVEFLPECSLIGQGPNDYEFTIDNVDVAFTDPTCPADYNHDGFVDGIDYDQFNIDFESADPLQQIHADYNGDGFVDGIDYDIFNADFEIGC